MRFMTPTCRPAVFLAALTLVPALTASCGGGGAAGSPPPPGSEIDESGSYSASEYGYEDPDPAGYHPLRTGTNVLTQFEELVILQPAATVTTARGTIFEDIGAGAGVIGELADLAGPAAYRTGAAGNLDEDGRDELVVGRITDGVPELLFLETEGDAAMSVTGSFEIGALGFTARELRLSLGDVDGDFRDEILVVVLDQAVGSVSNNVTARIYDDTVQGNVLIHEVLWPGSHPASGVRDVEMIAGDLDGDGRDEVALMALRGSNSVSAQISVLEDASTGFAQRVPWGNVKNSLPGDDTTGRLLVEDFDGDGVKAIAVVTFVDTSLLPSNQWIVSCEAKRYTLEEGLGVLQGWAVLEVSGSYSNFSGVFGSGTAPEDIAAVDLDADGSKELAVHIPTPVGTELRTFAWNGTDWDAGFETGGVPFNLQATELTLLPTDDDGDGQDELYACSIYNQAGGKDRLVLRYDFGDPSGPATGAWQASVSEPGPVYPPVLIGGEFDGEGLEVRHTGLKFTSLADPVRLVVLAAAPTKSGISQNYAATTTTYKETSTSAQSVGVTSGVTASVYSGTDISDITDLFGVNARQTISGALTKSQVQTSTQSITQGFTGPSTSDTIVFQGTLYQCYEYEILNAPDPSLIGDFYTLDVPVETKTYKWTVDYFNEQVSPEYRIESDLLTHTIGDPSSYVSNATADGLVDKYVGWKIPNDSTKGTVGQGTAFNSMALALTEEVQNSEELGLAVTWEAGFKVAGSTFGGSFGLTSSSIYSVTYSETNSYESVVGDIADFADYEAWAYDFGLTVYQHGLLSDSSNLPVENEDGIVPFQIVTYWTRPFGTAYP